MAAGKRLTPLQPNETPSTAVPAALRQRAQAMLDRVTTEARSVLPASETHVIRDALAAALAPRDARIADDHDSRCLHPGRTIRILISDGECRSADALAAAAFVDSVDPALVPVPHVATLRDFASAVPRPEDDDELLLERIVTADPDMALVALAERLDHARHLHLRHDLPWPVFHAQIRSVYLPAARRVSARIARRFEHWADAFERRLILPR